MVIKDQAMIMLEVIDAVLLSFLKDYKSLGGNTVPFSWLFKCIEQRLEG